MEEEKIKDLFIVRIFPILKFWNSFSNIIN